MEAVFLLIFIYAIAIIVIAIKSNFNQIVNRLITTEHDIEANVIQQQLIAKTNQCYQHIEKLYDAFKKNTKSAQNFLALSNKVATLHSYKHYHKHDLFLGLVKQSNSNKSQALYHWINPFSNIHSLQAATINELPRILKRAIKLQQKVMQLYQSNQKQKLIIYLDQLPIIDRVLINLSQFDFSHMDLRNTNLSAYRFHQVNFSKSDLSLVKFNYANLDRVNFTYSILLSTQLITARNLIDITSIRHANINKDTFQQLRRGGIYDFSNVKFYGDFANIAFNKITLSQADLRGCNLYGANFEHARIDGTAFNTPLNQCNIDEATTSSHPILQFIELKIINRLKKDKSSPNKKTIALSNEYQQFFSQLYNNDSYLLQMHELNTWINVTKKNFPLIHATLKKQKNTFDTFKNKVATGLISTGILVAMGLYNAKKKLRKKEIQAHQNSGP